MARAESNEHPHEVRVLAPRQLEHEGKRPLRGRCVDVRQIELGAAREAGAVGSERLAREQVIQSDPVRSIVVLAAVAV